LLKFSWGNQGIIPDAGTKDLLSMLADLPEKPGVNFCSDPFYG